MHILIAEDEDIIRETFTQMLEESGYSVEAAQNGKQAWEMAQQQEPNLLLTDIMMPEMTGFELIAQMKAHPTLKNVPIIILSNLEGGEDQEKGKQYGVHDYLIKSNLEVEEVIDIVEKYVKSIPSPVVPTSAAPVAPVVQTAPQPAVPVTAPQVAPPVAPPQVAQLAPKPVTPQQSQAPVSDAQTQSLPSTSPSENV